MKIDWVKSVVHCKCPKCRKAKLFTYGNHYNLSKLFEMPDRCPNCGQDFFIEPGFYLGAMWVSYPFVLLTDVALLAIFFLVFDMSVLGAFFSSLGIMLALLPPTIRISRSLFIHMNVRFDEKK